MALDGLRRLPRRDRALALLVFALGCSNTPAMAPRSSSLTKAPVRYVDLCPLEDGHRRCDVKLVTDPLGIPIHSLASPVGGYAPADLQAAYGLPASGGPGAGKIVAIFGGGDDYVEAESDLGVYRAQYGLPPCTTANGCFMKMDQNGGTNYPAPATNPGEQAVDMDMASAACPSCKIALIEGSDTGVMMRTLLAKGAVAFSFSIQFTSGPQPTAQSCADEGYNSPGGMLVTAALGDTGYPGTTDWFPTACQGTLAVGGTTLQRANNARGWSETAWSATGSGCATAVAKPSWQTDSGCKMRVSGDVSALADPNTGISAYCSTPNGCGGWGVVGGTSVSAPFVAGALTALGVADGKFSPAWVWKTPGNFHDITSGSDGSCAGYVCNAGPGFDGPTGWGTPNGQLLSTATPPGAAGACTMPSGSFLQSCTSCWVSAEDNGCLLTCQSCGKIDGTHSLGPTLELPCTGEIANSDGALGCFALPPDAGAADGGQADGGAMDGGQSGGGSVTDGGDGAPPQKLDASVPRYDAGAGASPPIVTPSRGCSFSGAGATDMRAIVLLFALLVLYRRRRQQVADRDRVGLRAL